MTSLPLDYAGHIPAPPLPKRVRVPRCRLHDEHGDPCPSPRVSDFGLCAHHLASAAGEFRDLAEQAGAADPGKLLDFTIRLAR